MGATTLGPLYFTTTTIGGVANSSILSNTSPGTANNSTSSISRSTLQGAISTIWRPQTAGGANTDTIPLAGVGWSYSPIGTAVQPTANDTWTMLAGNWNIQVAASGSSGLGTQTVAGTLGVMIYKVSSSGNSTNAVLMGYSNTTSISIPAGSQANVNVTVATAQTAFGSTDRVEVGIALSTAAAAGSLGGDTLSLLVNSNNSTIVFSTPAVTSQMARAIVDTTSVSDTVARAYYGSRSLSDAVSITDSITRAYTAARSLTDTTTVSDNIARQFVANRSLSDTVGPVVDTLTRRFIGYRALPDVTSVADVITRQVTYSRKLSENLTSGGGGTTTYNYGYARRKSTDMQTITANTPNSNVYLLMTSSTDHVSPVTGLSNSLTITVSTNGNAFTTFTGTSGEIGNGLYYITVPNSLAPSSIYSIKATGLGADPTLELVRVTDWNEVWNAPLPTNISGTWGDFVRNKVLTVAKFIGLK